MRKYLRHFTSLTLALSAFAACDAEDITPRESDPPLACGGFAGLACPDGQVCVDDPSDDCDPLNGGADCLGFCEDAPARATCGGFAGTACPKGQECVDDPSDDCDPLNGGADCLGFCEEPKQTKA